MSPYLDGVRVSLDVWRAANPRNPNVRRDVDGAVFRTEHFDDAGPAPDPATTDEYVERSRYRVTNAPGRLAAIAEALGVDPDAPEVAEVDLTGGEYTLGGHRIVHDSAAPWLDDLPEDERDEVLREDDEDSPVGSQPVQIDRSRPEGPEVAPTATPMPAGSGSGQSPAAGRTTRARESAFGESKGFTSKRNRPSQTPEGRRARLLKALVKAGKYQSISQAEQLVPRRPRPRKDPA